LDNNSKANELYLYVNQKNGTVFSANIINMTKKILLFALVAISTVSMAQKAQRIGYVDMEYILENIPEYNESQLQLNAKATAWQNQVDRQKKEIERLKAALNNERVLLTAELIVDREEDIEIKELDVKLLQESYFGSSGDLYILRQQLVQPIQDLIYNAIQDIATKRKYDFVLDNSNDLVLLYMNDQFDISDLILDSVNRTKKREEAEEKRQEVTSEITPEKSAAMSEKEAKKAELQKRIEDRKAAQAKQREELKKEIEAKRQKRIEEIEAAKKAKEKKKTGNN
jgi:Skp family chaperone for outer membrane proteins